MPDSHFNWSCNSLVNWKLIVFNYKVHDSPLIKALSLVLMLLNLKFKRHFNLIWLLSSNVSICFLSKNNYGSCESHFHKINNMIFKNPKKKNFKRWVEKILLIMKFNQLRKGIESKSQK